MDMIGGFRFAGTIIALGGASLPPIAAAFVDLIEIASGRSCPPRVTGQRHSQNACQSSAFGIFIPVGKPLSLRLSPPPSQGWIGPLPRERAFFYPQNHFLQ
jgi:hypothetical protein